MALVTIFNPTPQLVKASIRGPNGRPQHVALEGRATSAAVDESKITQHTKQLIARGMLKLRKVPPAPYVAPVAAPAVVPVPAAKAPAAPAPAPAV